MLNALYATAEGLGVRVLYETPAVDLDIDGPSVRSVTLRIEGQDVPILSVVR